MRWMLVAVVVVVLVVLVVLGYYGIEDMKRYYRLRGM
jgi:hypothetical protein